MYSNGGVPTVGDRVAFHECSEYLQSAVGVVTKLDLVVSEDGGVRDAVLVEWTEPVWYYALIPPERLWCLT